MNRVVSGTSRPASYRPVECPWVKKAPVRGQRVHQGPAGSEGTAAARFLLGPDQQFGHDPAAAGVTVALARSAPPAGRTPDVVPGLRWTGRSAPQKWMNFYTRVPVRFAASKDPSFH